MAKYKLLNGVHAQNKVTYYPGDIIESETDLVEVFGEEKFELGRSSDKVTVRESNEAVKSKKQTEERANLRKRPQPRVVTTAE